MTRHLFPRKLNNKLFLKVFRLHNTGGKGREGKSKGEEMLTKERVWGKALGEDTWVEVE
jgi:hypothetical protein